MTLVKKRTPELQEKEKQVKIQLIENILKVQALGFTARQIGASCEASQSTINQLLIGGTEYYLKLERAEKMLIKLQEFSVNCKNPEYITMLKLRDLYKMPNATMQELMETASKRAEKKRAEYKERLCTDI